MAAARAELRAVGLFSLASPLTSVVESFAFFGGLEGSSVELAAMVFVYGERYWGTLIVDGGWSRYFCT